MSIERFLGGVVGWARAGILANRCAGTTDSLEGTRTQRPPLFWQLFHKPLARFSQLFAKSIDLFLLGGSVGLSGKSLLDFVEGPTLVGRFDGIAACHGPVAAGLLQPGKLHWSRVDADNRSRHPR